jgi:hypothetical protein
MGAARAHEPLRAGTRAVTRGHTSRYARAHEPLLSVISIIKVSKIEDDSTAASFCAPTAKL